MYGSNRPLEENDSLKIVDPETSSYVDHSGVVWAGVAHWCRSKQVARNAINKGVKAIYGDWNSTPSEVGANSIIRGSKVVIGKSINLYSELVIDQILAYILEAERQLIEGIYQLRDETKTEVLAVYKTASSIADEVPMSYETVQRKLRKSTCAKLTDVVNRYSGKVETVYDIDEARKLFQAQIEVAVSTDEKGEYTHARLGRCVNLKAYCKGKSHIGRRRLSKLVKDNGVTRLRRRDLRTNHIIFLYPESELDRIVESS